MVDILASPVREQKHKSGSSKPSISVRKAEKELAEKHGVMKSFEAMQTDWALHAQATLDKDLQRGAPKAETKRDHLPPEVYAAIVEKGMAESVERLKPAEKLIGCYYLSAISGTSDHPSNFEYEDGRHETITRTRGDFEKWIEEQSLPDTKASRGTHQTAPKD